MAGESIERDFRDMLMELASIRPDFMPVKARKALVRAAVERLQQDFEARRVLEQWKDFKCSSRHAYKRLVMLCQQCLLEGKQVDQPKPIIDCLCRILQDSCNPDLVESCRKDLLARKEQLQWGDYLYEIAVQESNLAAVSLGSALDKNDSNRNWLTVVMNIAVSKFSTASELALCRSFLAAVPVQSWKQEIAPPLLLKLKSHPDKALDTLSGFITYVKSLDVDEELLAVLLKHVVSAKDSNREAAARSLVQWAISSATARQAIVDALATTNVALVPARTAIYEILEKIATHTSDNVDCSKVLQGIATLLTKDTKVEQRAGGQKALVAWVQVAKRQGQSKGYDVALDALRKPILAKNPTSEAGQVLSYLARTELVGPITQDLNADKQWSKGMEAFIEAASKKKAMQVEGLLAVYLCLVDSIHVDKPLSAEAAKVVSAGSSSKANSSFLYADSMVESIPSSDVIGEFLPKVILKYSEMAIKRSTFASLFSKGKETSASRIMAACLMHSTSNESLQGLRRLLDLESNAAESLVRSLFSLVNTTSAEMEEQVRQASATREARESEKLIVGKGQGSENAAHCGFDPSIVRYSARQLVSCCTDASSLAKTLALMHVGTSLKSEGHQRAALMVNTLHTIRDVILKIEMETMQGDLANEICSIVVNYANNNEPLEISQHVHEAALSLLLSLGGIASNFSPAGDAEDDDELKPYVFASQVCMGPLAEILADKLNAARLEIEKLSESDVALSLTSSGTLFIDNHAAASGYSMTKNKRMSEDEAWELEMKRELEERKRMEAQRASAMSAEELKQVSQQDQRRQEIKCLIDFAFIRSLNGIRQLVTSDIEVGNGCLPLVTESVVFAAVSECPASRQIPKITKEAFSALTDLATCVYEIHERHAPTLAQAIVLSCLKRTDDKSDVIEVVPLPSPCAPAAVTVFEIDQFHDVLSGNSFCFLCPVVRACLLGPRTPTGCEHALRILDRHTSLLHGDEYDPVVASLRKDMIVSVLDLLKHDRSQTFQEPSAMETLVHCFKSDQCERDPPLTTAELAPLLDERGAIGLKNCRLGSMVVLETVANDHPKLVRNNPLIESRVWLNCYDEADEIRAQARKTWCVMRGTPLERDASEGLPPPSPLFAASLLPLLSHEDPAISKAAAAAFAQGMASHPSSMQRNFESLAKTFVDSFPIEDSDTKSSGSSLPAKSVSIASAIPKKKSAPVLALPKKKTPVAKSPLAVAAGIGKPKVAKKKSAAHAALLKPKEERTLDQATLESQFKNIPIVKKEEKDSPERVRTRQGVLRTISALSSQNAQVAESTLQFVTSFLMAFGIADPNDDVKGMARDALRDIVATNGGSDEAVAFLLPHLEAVLKTGEPDGASLAPLDRAKIPSDVGASDRRKEGAVVALGAAAIHLKGSENEAKIDTTIEMLIDALETPSEDVQVSVADTLVKLMKKGKTQDRIEDLLSGLMKSCLYGDSLAKRRGAAYGLSAAVKGSGITTLKKFDIVKKLEEACSAGDASCKEGSLFAIELLSTQLGLLFEPYVIVLLPSLLKSFSDSSDYVRKAASHATGLIMSKLSAHGVKLVMPAVLAAFNDPAWRTKQASISMLGAMSHLAPKQLASALPKVVPKLIEAFSDTHPKVKASAEEALHEICGVVRNPEISSISQVLLKALTDPADSTIYALETLIETEFLHAIDAPSLALIVPILHRGLRDRGATTKRFGGLIAGNICTMINDPKDFLPYLPTLLPDLQSALLDPIPDVRSTAAKALGSLTRSLGDHIVADLRPWLMLKLRDASCSSAERSGAAQGLAEVLVSSGSVAADETVRNEIIPLHSFPEASTREGALWTLSFLPPLMGQGFTPLLDASLPALISGLSDESEPVRDVAMRAGRVLIRSHGRVHVDKILPSLEAGLENEDYRIRVASLSLLGDLLSLIGGTSVVKGDGSTQDDIRKAERAQAQIALALGSDTRKRVLSGLYLARSDSVYAVRQSALQVWKTIVSVTARTLRDILATLVEKIVKDLASGDEEKTIVAGRCLGDVVTKLGDSVLPQIIPVLRNALYEGDEYTRQGVCVGLTEIIKCSTKDQIMRFLEIIVKVVQDALSDENADVRKMAAVSFQSLHSVVGNRVLDEIVPSLMVALEDGVTEEAKTRALHGLTGIISVRSRELLPYIIPRLLSRPITTPHAHALTGIAEVTASTLHFHYSSIIPTILQELAESDVRDAEREECIRAIARAVAFNADSVGVNWLVSEISAKCTSDKATIRREACKFMATVITERASKEDFYEQVPVMLRELLNRLNDDNAEVLKANHEAFTALTSKVPAEELVKHVEFMRNLLASTVSEARHRKGGVGEGEFLMPGFNIPKGIEPLIPIFQRGILYGNPTIREASAAGLGEVIAITSTKFLAGPIVVKMTGPLLRIVGDRNPSSVKVAILKTLGLILQKGGPALRAFVPQFQTTFVKALSDPSRQVRVEAIGALALLMPLSTRVDPLIKELVSGASGLNVNAEGSAAIAVQTASLEALATVLEYGGEKAKLPASVPSALDAAKDMLESNDEGIRDAAAKVVGVSCNLLGTDATHTFIKEDLLRLLSKESSESRHGTACAIRRILERDVGKTLNEDSAVDTVLNKKAAELALDSTANVRHAGWVALLATIGRSKEPVKARRAYEAKLLAILQNTRESMDLHRAIALALCVSLQMIPAEQRIDFLGLDVMDGCLQLAMKGSQRVQFAYNDVLYLALNVAAGDDRGLQKYTGMTVFDNVRAVKSLHAKVLTRINRITTLDE